MFLIFFFFTFFFYYSFFKLSFLGLSFNYFYLSSEFFSTLMFNLCLDFWVLLFFFMVAMVTSFVVLYSEVYMEHYNNFKFFSLLLLFFSSMLMLVSSSSFMTLMMGWDGLGITSICLIMFYPNKMTMYNSVLTMFFNRMGDVSSIFLICLGLLSFSNFFFFVDSFYVSLLVLICSFSKSAQFPLSCWLPAAMSAPTPISAMVHSSTLVTAGIFFVQKMYFFLQFYNLISFLVCFSALTFLIGGLMANLELDFKKMVAFSTMSQVSMIMFFLCIFGSLLSFFHMVLHAFFKTLLFCCSGVVFIFKFSDQLKNHLHVMKNYILSNLLFISIFAMSGFIFSSSFFSKDLALEILVSSFFLSKFLILFFGSFATIFYCSKLLFSLIYSRKSLKFEISKIFYFNFFLLFYLLVSFFSKNFLFLFMEIYPICSSFLVIFILSIFIFCLMINLHSSNNFFYFFTYMVGLMKFISYSIFSYLSSGWLHTTVTFNDTFFFKSSNINFIFFLQASKELLFSYSLYLILSLVLLSLMFLYLSSLNENMALKQLSILGMVNALTCQSVLSKFLVFTQEIFIFEISSFFSFLDHAY